VTGGTTAANADGTCGRCRRACDEHLLVALTDQLTGLPVRRLFLDRLEAGLRRSGNAGLPVSVFFVDLDGFKAVNDVLGHTAGDAMLRATTRRLLQVVPGTDRWGRIGGDEFVLFVEACDPELALDIATKLASALRQRLVIGGRAIHTSASIGFTTLDDRRTDAESAVRQADIAMFEGKRTRRDSVTMFVPEMQRRVVVRAELERQLRETLTGAGPNVVYQPIVDMTSGRTVAVEALARWSSRTHGPISPERFIGMAESMGVIDVLDQHVLRTACRAIAGMTDPSSGLPIDLTVNSSTLNLSNLDVADRVLGVLDDEGFPCHRMILEVTESIAVEDDAILRDQLRALRRHGVRIALDDFGTGNSSLAQLETLPVDFVKVDRSFLDGVPESPRRLRYLQTIVEMANALDLRVIFEGIERHPQLGALTGLGVTLGQGYLLAEPGSATSLARRMCGATGLVRAVASEGLHFQPVLQWAASGC
jgi:diguanylate cyclase (GGDEF)-like protein